MWIFVLSFISITSLPLKKDSFFIDPWKPPLILDTYRPLVQVQWTDFHSPVAGRGRVTTLTSDHGRVISNICLVSVRKDGHRNLKWRTTLFLNRNLTSSCSRSVSESLRSNPFFVCFFCWIRPCDSIVLTSISQLFSEILCPDEDGKHPGSWDSLRVDGIHIYKILIFSSIIDNSFYATKKKKKKSVCRNIVQFSCSNLTLRIWGP